MKKINYRKCRRKDLIPAARMIGISMNYLRRQSGMEPYPWRVREIPPLFNHLLKTDPDLTYCAWDGERLVGFGSALVRGKQWYLGHLFVLPRYQDNGVGRKLLEKVWADKPGMTHALCTFAFNMQAVGIYSKFGMTPLCDLPWMHGDPAKMKKLGSTGLKIIDTPTRADYKWLNELETKIRGYPHALEWKLWQKSEKHKVYIFTSRGKRIGYCQIVDKRMIAPLGVISKRYMTKVMTEAIRLAKPKKDGKINLWCPTLNIELYQFLIGIGFRADEMEIFMSDEPYPDWQRYVPATLAVV
ncbi:MAG: GNAT family N-acetyltransferase [candidate division Zixibacteria bacterium]|nr:GNAT family N-acetyltransferase [candidate division Zixibacteria bacterium]